MIGIIPGNKKTFEVFGSFTDSNLVEGKLYYDPKDERIYLYSKTESRSNPDTGFFPIWNGKEKFISNFSKEKYMSKDVIKTDIHTLCSSIDKDVADNVLYLQRRSTNDEILRPKISDEDNMFTQCIKGILNEKELTIIDLVDMSSPKLDEKIIEGYYNALTKITFMRINKWEIWINEILHVGYKLIVTKNNKKLLTYEYPKDKFDTGIVKYNDIIKSEDDPFKKIIKILMIMENINKNMLRSDQVDDYTINNMITSINGSKPLSAQIFSRFIRMAKLSYSISIIEKGQVIFNYKE